jgi:hypothetical protein
MKSLFTAALGFIAFTGFAVAQSPVAVVEDVQGDVTGAEFMDYVSPGAVIKMGPDGKIILGYMKSCRRETITGAGTAIVGSERSTVQLSQIQADEVQCDSSHSQLLDRETRESAASVIRGLVDDGGPQVTIYGLSPVIEATHRGKLVVERVDVSGERYYVNFTATSLTRGKFYDFAKTGTALQAGGTYAASLGAQRIVFRIDPAAASGQGPIIGRLVSLE